MSDIWPREGDDVVNRLIRLQEELEEIAEILDEDANDGAYSLRQAGVLVANVVTELDA